MLYTFVDIGGSYVFKKLKSGKSFEKYQNMEKTKKRPKKETIRQNAINFFK